MGSWHEAKLSLLFVACSLSRGPVGDIDQDHWYKPCPDLLYITLYCYPYSEEEITFLLYADAERSVRQSDSDSESR